MATSMSMTVVNIKARFKVKIEVLITDPLLLKGMPYIHYLLLFKKN